ncbi:MAG: TrpR YerC/YecD [Eubacterium sp.]|jgi:TrpR-related protein YerC/YecD|nr:TrpR YerC/YecD [Eubacterium sp.]HBE09290.1 TrpR YerC/YecD [Lachnospiraceae bacterium]
MRKTIRTESVDELFEAIMSLKDKEEFYEFFEDICTANEVVSIAQRLEVAKMLHENKTYTEIAAETGASTATISRVNRSMNYGNGSYEYIFKRLGTQLPES